MSAKLGLVMTGGGARAAYQVGVVRAIYEIIKKDQMLFDIITGNSAGAINSAYLASSASNWDVATQNLCALWKNLKPEHVFDLRKRTITDLGLKWVSGTFLGGLTPTGSHINYLLDTEPLRAMLSKEIDFTDIRRNVENKFIHGVSLSTTNYNSGSSVIFYQGEDSIKDWSRSDRFSFRQDLNVNHVMASSAIPFFFPPTQVGDSFFGDGCIRQTTPLSPAIHLGARKIIAVGVRYPHPQGIMKEQAFAPFSNPTMGQIVGVMLNSIFLDSLESDVERLIKYNELISQGQHEEFKSIPILMLRPSRDLGQMSKNLNAEMPPMLRYLLKGIGVSDKAGLDLLSYLAFDSSYTMPLMDLGYEDTFKMKNEIEEFIGV